MGAIWRRYLVCTTAMAGALLVAPLAATARPAQEPTYEFTLPVKPLREALADFGRTTGKQLLFSDDVVGERMAPQIMGRRSPDGALTELLAGTDLTWRAAPGGAIMVMAKEPPRPQAQPAADAAAERLSELVVVGSRFARKQDGPAPVTILDREAIDRLGVANVADVLNYIPQQSFSLNERSSPGGARRVQLRGLNAGAALVLINGRRVVPGAVGAASGYFDLNTIPLPAVERVEVLADSASAVYGADAVGGVVNIVTKSTIAQPVLDASFGAADGGAEERRVSLSVGGESPRARGVVTVDYFQRDELLGMSRDYVGNADFRRFGGVDRRVPTANPGNICTVSGLNLPGLAAPCAAAPARGSLSPSSQDIVLGARNLDSLERYRSIVPPSQRYSAAATGAVDLTNSITAYAELMYADRTDEAIGAPPAISRGIVPASNPFNTFGVPVRADFLITALGSVVNEAHEVSYREVLGLRGRIGPWNWDISALGAQSRADYTSTNTLDPSRVAAALAASAPAQALNVFEAGAGGSQALLTSLVVDAAAAKSSFASRSTQLGGFVRGDLFPLPAGDVQMVAGAEWRRESISVMQPLAGLSVSSSMANRTSGSGYVELRAPLLGEAATPLRNLALTLAGRYDRYSDFGDTFNAQYGLEWRPAETLLVRASYGDSFRAPGLYELFQSQTGPYITPLVDPRRNSEGVVASYIVGGNPDLDPERSNSLSFGPVWTPDVIGRPRLSLSYWRIRQDRRILSFVAPTAILANERYYPDRVTRAAPTAADIAAGLPGQVVSVDARLLNLGRLETEGLDLEATAQFDTDLGRFSPRLTATRVGSYKAADFPVTPVTERVGIANSSGTVPRWRAVGTLTWSRPGLSLTGTARYVSAYDDARSGVFNGLRVPSQTLVDVQGSADLGAFFTDAALGRGRKGWGHQSVRQGAAVLRRARLRL